MLRNAAFLTTQAHARKPSTSAAPFSRSADRAIAALTGSGWQPGPISVRAAMSPSRGSASNTATAVASAPGSHQESSSLNATYGVWARRTPALRAAVPALRASATISTPGKLWAAASALPSADPLSTTITGGRSGSRVSMPSVRSSSPRRLRVATTTVTRLTGHAVRAPGNTSPRSAPPRGGPAWPRLPPGPASGLPTHRSSLLPPMVTWCGWRPATRRARGETEASHLARRWCARPKTAALDHLPDGGCVINTASINGLRGNKSLIDYAASKGAVLALIYSLAQSFQDRGIRVNSVAPGPVWTPLIPSTFPPEKVEEFGQQVPMGRAAQPDEIAPSYLFFAAPQLSSYYSGEVLAPTGGETLPG